ncbi:MAG TPA: hypothetical protein VFH47_01105, partial [Candidatus Thermoplasmatota archaeon]|nr:hypothetical protein [Candidatus Thermoplasmatota archaeon]
DACDADDGRARGPLVLAGCRTCRQAQASVMAVPLWTLVMLGFAGAALALAPVARWARNR